MSIYLTGQRKSRLIQKDNIILKMKISGGFCLSSNRKIVCDNKKIILEQSESYTGGI